MLYHCNYCNLSTNKKSNWKRHILTKKHINNIKKNKSQKHCKTVISINNNKNEYKCLYCNAIYNHSQSLSRHKNNCMGKEIYNIKQELDKIKNHKLLQCSNNISTVVNNQINNYHSTMNIIIHKYPNAPNLSDIKQIKISDENMRKYIDKGIPDGAIEFIKDVWIKGTNPSDMPFWCVDPSRTKYIVKINNNWEVDMGGDKIKNEILPIVKKTFIKFVGIENSRINEIPVKNMENLLDMQKNNGFIVDLINKKNQKKILKKLTNYMIYNKNKLHN